MIPSTKPSDSDKTTALEEYVKAASEHGRGTESGDSDRANVAYERRGQLLARFFAGEGREQLVMLLKHEEPSVRLWAAVDTYRLDPRRSVEVLEAVAREPGLVGFSAEMTLRELKSGRLVPP